MQNSTNSNRPRILVTGGGTFLGDHIAAALLALGAEVTLLVRPGAEDNLGPLAQRTTWRIADVWNPASLKGRARGHASVIHTVGSMTADPAKGLTHHWLNFVSARNVANMCVGDGVNHMVLMSSARAPWVNGRYLSAKREAEAYMDRVGLRATVIRAPIAYMRVQRRHPFWVLMTLLGGLPPFSWLWLGRIAPMPVDVLARGVARITLEKNPGNKIFYYASDLRKYGRGGKGAAMHNVSQELRRARRRPEHPIELLDDNVPFGWTPPETPKKK